MSVGPVGPGNKLYQIFDIVFDLKYHLDHFWPQNFLKEMKFVNLLFFLWWCQIVLGVKLSSLHGRCQIVLFCMMVSNCPRCQIVLFAFMVSNCPTCHYGVKLSEVSNGSRIPQSPMYTNGPSSIHAHTDIYGSLCLCTSGLHSSGARKLRCEE